MPESQFNYLFTLKNAHLSLNIYNFRMQPNIPMKFAGYVAWILLCKPCKFGEKIHYNSGDIKFFLGDYFFSARPVGWHLVAPILLIFLFSAKTKTPDRKHNLSTPYIILKVYSQTVWLDGDHGRITPPPLDSPLTIQYNTIKVFKAPSEIRWAHSSETWDADYYSKVAR